MAPILGPLGPLLSKDDITNPDAAALSPERTKPTRPSAPTASRAAQVLRPIQGALYKRQSEDGSDSGESSSSSNLSGGAIAGIVVGSIVGFLLLIWILKSCGAWGRPNDFAARGEPASVYNDQSPYHSRSPSPRPRHHSRHGRSGHRHHRHHHHHGHRRHSPSHNYVVEKSVSPRRPERVYTNSRGRRMY